jgi:hypothetical protein
MTDQSAGVDLPALLANLVQQQTAVVQQQTAMVQQQAALLQVHSESLQLQRLLVERLLGITPASVAVSQSEAPAFTTTSQPAAAPQPVPPSDTPATHCLVTPSRGTDTAAERGDDIPSTRAAETVAPAAAGTESGAGLRPIASHTARYYQSRPVPALAPVQPQDLELMRRLHEMRDASDLILQFGPHKGNTLAQVAMHDPDYVRQLVVRAQRPEVRAAAGRLVEALDAAAAHKPRAGRGAERRSRPTM